MRWAILLLFLLPLACSPPGAPKDSSKKSERLGYPTLEGHEVGNGGGDVSLKQAAWFTDKHKTLKICLQVSPAFSLLGHDLPGLVKSSYQQWQDYYFDRNEESVANMFSPFPADLEVTQECSKGDLNIYFGVVPEEVARQLKRYRHPTGVVHRESFSADRNWSQGWMWFPDPHHYQNKGDTYPHWKEHFRLYGQILHLWGHVFGNVNFEKTIMSGKIVQWIKEPSSSKLKRKLSSIDGEKYLIRPHYVYSDEVHFSGRIFSENWSEAFGQSFSPQGLFQTNLGYKFRLEPDLFFEIKDIHGSRLKISAENLRTTEVLSLPAAFQFFEIREILMGHKTYSWKVNRRVGINRADLKSPFQGEVILERGTDSGLLLVSLRRGSRVIPLFKGESFKKGYWK